MTCQGMAGLTPLMNWAISVSSASESLCPGMTRVVTSTQTPFCFNRVMVSSTGCKPGLAHLAVEIVPHALQIHVIGVNEFRQGVGGGLGHEAVGHKDVAQVVFPGQAGHVLGVLEEDGGFGVGVGDAGRMGPQGIGHNGFRVALVSQDLAAVDPGILGNVVVLAVEAHEVAARGGDGIGPGARQEVKQGLFLNGVDVLGNDLGRN